MMVTLETTMLRRTALTLALLAALPATADDLGDRIAALRPADEAWRHIHWRTDLAAARREAADRDRPLYIWSMDGHPMGCT